MQEAESAQEICSHCGQPTVAHTPETCSLAAEIAEYKEKLQNTKDAEGITPEFEAAVKSGKITYEKQIADINQRLEELFSVPPEQLADDKADQLPEKQSDDYSDEVLETHNYISNKLRKASELIDDRPKKAQYSAEWQELMDRAMDHAKMAFEGGGQVIPVEKKTIDNTKGALIRDIEAFISRLENEEYTPTEKLFDSIEKNMDRCWKMCEEIDNILEAKGYNVPVRDLQEYISLKMLRADVSNKLGALKSGAELPSIATDYEWVTNGLELLRSKFRS